MSRLRLGLLALLLFVAGIALGVRWSGSLPKDGAQAMTEAKSASPRVLRPSAQDKALVELMAVGRQTNGSAVYNLVIFNFYSSIWKQYGKGVQRPVILELGPGSNLALGTLFVAAGATKYTGLDLFKAPDLENPDSYAAAFNLLNLVSPGIVRVKSEEIFSVSDGKVVFKPNRMEYLFPRQSYDIRLPDGSVDFVFSHSVFEHISDPDRTIAAIHKVLRKGGISAHNFDMRDHTDFSKPLEFLKVDEPAWKARFTGEKAYSYTNRRRLSDMVKAMEAAGFKMLKVAPAERIPMSEEIRAGLHPDFQKYSLEDLAVVGALIVAEKP